MTDTDSKFTPHENPQTAPDPIECQDFDFQCLVSTPVTFSSTDFDQVMANFILHPNLTSTHLFRADVFYDSLNDTSFDPDANSDPNKDLSAFVKHMKRELRPLRARLPGLSLARTIVRQLVPRNPQLDRPLVQTCHSFESKDARRYLVLYLPHVSSAEDMPWYHPAVKALAFLYSGDHDLEIESGKVVAPATISIHCSAFEGVAPTTRLERTALNLLRVVQKHGNGRRDGYVKRVHHDRIIPQARFQNTYARLKTKYAKEFIKGWVEQTDPTKHVFEDLGIAAFLIELWRDMYDFPCRDGMAASSRVAESDVEIEAKPAFPGFVDIGCGNGVLVHILLREGYSGWGFDLRRRKTWATFANDIATHLKEYTLVPEVLFGEDSSLHDRNPDSRSDAKDTSLGRPPSPGVATTAPREAAASAPNNHSSNKIHTGVFPTGTFIISNHADELTAWTPLLASLSRSPFIAIPCCSHDLAGARFRAPARMKAPPPRPPPQGPTGAELVSSDERPPGSARLPQRPRTTTPPPPPLSPPRVGPATTPVPSAYASLCTYVCSLAEETGYKPVREMLRIPSTRNAAIVGRRAPAADPDGAAETEAEAGRMRTRAVQIVQGVVERELGRPLAQVRAEWLERAGRIAGKKGDGH